MKEPSEPRKPGKSSDWLLIDSNILTIERQSRVEVLPPNTYTGMCRPTGRDFGTPDLELDRVSILETFPKTGTCMIF